MAEHSSNCPITTTPDPDGMYWVLNHPDGHHHCMECHCSCEVYADGPRCGHYAGCPGC